MIKLPYPPDQGMTHHADCWSLRGHHNCAVGKVEELRALLCQVAATPELLEACRAALENYSLFTGPLTDQLRAAIKKAEGEDG